MKHLNQIKRTKQQQAGKLELKCKYRECNNSFLPKHGRHIFCSAKCKSDDKAYGKRLIDRPPVNCAYEKCGKLFKKTNANQICCSDECKNLRLASPDLSAKRYPQGYFKPKLCRDEECGKEFVPRAPSQHYCSEECKGYNSYYMRQYGITQAEFNRMKDKQGGVCYLCGSDGFVIGRLGHSERLAVDHCHDTGRVRKLLCHNCNRGLGLFQDNPELLKKAFGYLRYFKHNL
ncbi:endonuclease VII domain-containing protein [Vibrio parahaemolyticus]